jgi:ATP-dependent Clp protease ATP-binding subunit ClpA
MYPFERFTERAKKVLSMAQEESVKADQSYIGTEHLLVGLLRERDGLAAKVLDTLGVSIDDARQRIESLLVRGQSVVAQQIIPTARVKKVIELSFEEARRMGHEFVGTEHLLLGILIEGEGVAAHVLQEVGVGLEGARAETERLLSSGEVEPRPRKGETGPPSLSLQLGDLLMRAGREAASQGQGVTGLDHLLRVLVDQAGHEELTAVLDRHGVSWNPPDELRALAARIHEVGSQTADATQRKDYETAANLRRDESRLREEHRRAELKWIASTRQDDS